MTYNGGKCDAIIIDPFLTAIQRDVGGVISSLYSASVIFMLASDCGDCVIVWIFPMMGGRRVRLVILSVQKTKS